MSAGEPRPFPTASGPGTPRPADFRHPGRETLAVLVFVPAMVLVAAVALVLTHHRDVPPSAAVAAGSGSVVGPAVPGPLAGTTAPQPARPAKPTGSPSIPRQAVQAVPAPRLGATLLMRPGSTGVDVRTWQARMAQRGWRLAVDGVYGPQSAAVARSFQHQKRLRTDGRVGRQTWTAAWTTPITAA